MIAQPRFATAAIDLKSLALKDISYFYELVRAVEITLQCASMVMDANLDELVALQTSAPGSIQAQLEASLLPLGEHFLCQDRKVLSTVEKIHHQGIVVVVENILCAVTQCFSLIRAVDPLVTRLKSIHPHTAQHRTASQSSIGAQQPERGGSLKDHILFNLKKTRSSRSSSLHHQRSVSQDSASFSAPQQEASQKNDLTVNTPASNPNEPETHS
jgi:hypothetical protein